MAASSRPPLGSGIVTLIVVDAVLVLVFLVMLWQFTRPDVGANPSSSTSPSATQTAAEGDEVVFTLPSRNITCVMAADATTCAIAEFEYDPPEVAGCEGSTGYEIEVTPEGARWLCTEGAPPGPASEGTDVLDYGSAASSNGYTCESSEQGVACRHDESGNAFSLARASGGPA